MGAPSPDTVLRVQKTERYKTIFLEAVEDRELSWKAKGIHTYLLSRPDGWRFNVVDLRRRATDGQHALTTGLSELQAKDYLRIERPRDREGRYLGSVWTVSEVPFDRLESSDMPPLESPHVDFPHVGSPRPGNRAGSKQERSKKNGKKSGDHGSPPGPGSGDGARQGSRPAFPSRWFAHLVQTLLWQGKHPPPEAPPRWCMSAELGELREVWTVLGREELARRLVGLRVLADEGELAGIEPEEGFTIGLLRARGDTPGPSLWSEAATAAAKMGDATGGELMGSLVEDILEGGAGRG